MAYACFLTRRMRHGRVEESHKCPEYPPFSALTCDTVLHFPPNANRATNLPIDIDISDRKLATAPPKVNESEKSGSASLGKFTLKRGTSITITLSNKGADGYVVADGVQLLQVR